MNREERTVRPKGRNRLLAVLYETSACHRPNTASDLNVSQIYRFYEEVRNGRYLMGDRLGL